MNTELNEIILHYFSIFGYEAIDKIKIDHYSWAEDSIYRYFGKKLINERLMSSVDIAVENEFFNWSDEQSKKFVIEGLGLMHVDRNIPLHDAWDNAIAFENVALETLISLVTNNIDLELTEFACKVENDLQHLRKGDNLRLIQVYQRILYELYECSLREFAALKSVVSNRLT